MKQVWVLLLLILIKWSAVKHWSYSRSPISAMLDFQEIILHMHIFRQEYFSSTFKGESHSIISDHLMLLLLPGELPGPALRLQTPLTVPRWPAEVQVQPGIGTGAQRSRAFPQTGEALTAAQSFSLTWISVSYLASLTLKSSVRLRRLMEVLISSIN